MLWLLAVLLQNPAPSTPPPTDPPGISLARVKRGLEKGPPPFDAPRDRPVFRITIRERMLPSRDPWQESTMRPAYVRTRQPPTHFEFLQQVTPKDFRAATLYPIGIDVLPILRWLARAGRGDSERRAKEEVERELREFLASRSQPK